MLYREIAPSAPLARVVERLWTLERDYRGPFPDHEHLWADIQPKLIFTVGARYRAGHESRRLPASFVIGPTTRSFDLHSAGLTTLVSARLHPWGLAAFSDLPVARHVDRLTPMIAALGDRAPLIDRSLMALDPEPRLREFGRRLTAAMHAAFNDAPGKAVCNALLRSPRTSVSAAAERSGISVRQLERTCRAHTGLTPILLQKIARFIAAKRRIESDPSVPLARVALECGYVDQPHFATTFRKLFDVTPAHFCRQVREAHVLLRVTKSDVVFLQERGER